MNPTLASIIADGVYVGGGVILLIVILLLVWVIFFRGR